LRFFGVLLGETPADLDGFAGDPAGGVGGEEADDGGDFVGCAEAAEGGAADERVLVFLRRVGGEFGFDESGKNGVDGDAAGAELFPVAVGELFERALGLWIN